MDHERDPLADIEEDLRRRASEIEREQLEREISGNLTPADEEIIDLREERLWHEAAPFGACPECGKSDGYRNIYRRHFFCCDEHRLTWCPGSNLMSSWRDEDEEDWRQAWEHLKGYRTVDGFGEYAPGATLGEQTTLEALLPDH